MAAEQDLANRIKALRADFESVCGKPFEHFYCPILGRDEPAAMCRGHVINDAFKSCNAWVPQRQDVDSFFGTAVEADLVSVVENRKKDSLEIWMDRKSRRRIRPKLFDQDQQIEFYFPKDGALPVTGHATVGVLNENNDLVCDLSVKMSESDIMKKDGIKLSLVIDEDFRSPVIASMLKAAHLTLFRMLGYRHVFSPGGNYLSHILRAFFEKHQPPKKCTGADVEKHFFQFQKMIAPMQYLDASLQGTVMDNMLISLYGQSGAVFAIGVIIKAGPDAFCVFVPGMPHAIDTYFSFLKEPPPSVAMRITHYRPASGADEACWEIPPGEPMRLSLQPLAACSDEIGTEN